MNSSSVLSFLSSLMLRTRMDIMGTFGSMPNLYSMSAPAFIPAISAFLCGICIIARAAMRSNSSALPALMRLRFLSRFSAAHARYSMSRVPSIAACMASFAACSVSSAPITNASLAVPCGGMVRTARAQSIGSIGALTSPCVMLSCPIASIMLLPRLGIINASVVYTASLFSVSASISAAYAQSEAPFTLRLVNSTPPACSAASMLSLTNAGCAAYSSLSASAISVNVPTSARSSPSVVLVRLISLISASRAGSTYVSALSLTPCSSFSCTTRKSSSVQRHVPSPFAGASVNVNAAFPAFTAMNTPSVQRMPSGVYFVMSLPRRALYPVPLSHTNTV